MSIRTKQMFADKLEQLAKNKPIKEIQIKELCEACGVERTTFYYHFCDKYELIAWVFEQMFSLEARFADIINNEEMIARMLQHIYEKRDFFANALQDYSQNNLREYILSFYIDSEEKVLKKYLQTDVLDKDLHYSIKSYSYGCMGMTIEWLLGKIECSAKEMAYQQYRLMPELLKEAYKTKNES